MVKIVKDLLGKEEEEELPEFKCCLDWKDGKWKKAEIFSHDCEYVYEIVNNIWLGWDNGDDGIIFSTEDWAEEE